MERLVRLCALPGKPNPRSVFLVNRFRGGEAALAGPPSKYLPCVEPTAL